MSQPLHTPLPAPRAVAPVLPPRRRRKRPDFLDLIVGRQLVTDVERDGETVLSTTNADRQR